jgi:two-component system sensor histidine kinase YesM
MILILIAGIIPTLIVTCYMQMGMMNTLKEREMENMQESLKQAVDAIDDQAQIYENLIDYLSYSGDLRKVLKMERASDFNTYLKYTQVADPLLNMPQVYHKEIKGITLYADNIQVAHGSTLAPLSEIQGESWYPRNNRSLIRWYVQTGSQNKVIVARKFYDGSSEINAVLKITLDYNKLFEPFEKIMESDFAGIVWDENGNVVYSCNKIIKNFISNFRLSA